MIVSHHHSQHRQREDDRKLLQRVQRATRIALEELVEQTDILADVAETVRLYGGEPKEVLRRYVTHGDLAAGLRRRLGAGLFPCRVEEIDYEHLLGQILLHAAPGRSAAGGRRGDHR